MKPARLVLLLCLSSVAQASCPELSINLSIPCKEAATRALYTNKNIGLQFNGARSFKMHSFDQLVVGSVDANDKPSDQDVCMAAYTTSDATQIDLILSAKVSPHATIAPGNGQWISYSGSKPQINESQCYVTYAMGDRRVSVDQYAAARGLPTLSPVESKAIAQCEGLLGTYGFSGGSAPTPESMSAACHKAVSSISGYVGLSEISCSRVEHEAYAFKCVDAATSHVIAPIAVSVDPSGSVAEALTPVVPIEALPITIEL